MSYIKLDIPETILIGKNTFFSTRSVLFIRISIHIVIDYRILECFIEKNVKRLVILLWIWKIYPFQSFKNLLGDLWLLLLIQTDHHHFTMIINNQFDSLTHTQHV